MSIQYSINIYESVTSYCHMPYFDREIGYNNFKNCCTTYIIQKQMLELNRENIVIQALV